jgi:hypothetical protein
MTPEIELLEKYGLVRDEDSLSVDGFAIKRFLRLYEQLYSQIYKRQVENHWQRNTDEIDPFTFMASASMRADSTCGSPECRAVKLDFLGRYTALYANKVILPLWLAPPDQAANAPKTARYELSRSVQSLLQLRPLIEAGLIEPVVMRSPHCKHTVDWARRLGADVNNAAMSLTRDASPDFMIVYQPPEKSPTGESTIYVEGPRDLLEHGYMVWTWDEGSNWRAKSWRFDSDGKVEIRGAKKVSKLYEMVFDKIASDTSFYLAFARLQSARYLSDREGETILLDALTDDDDVSADNARLQQCLTHLVPLLGDLPLATLLRIRREERDSFIRYRSALSQLLNEIVLRKRRIGKREIQELYRDKIEPELHRMKSELRQEQKRQSRRIIGGAVSLAASVALGAFGGFLPLLAKGAAVGATAMVGGRLFSKAAEEVCEHGANLRERNDFYFLVRTAQESE